MTPQEFVERAYRVGLPPRCLGCTVLDEEDRMVTFRFTSKVDAAEYALQMQAIGILAKVSPDDAAVVIQWL